MNCNGFGVFVRNKEDEICIYSLIEGMEIWRKLRRQNVEGLGNGNSVSE